MRATGWTLAIGLIVGALLAVPCTATTLRFIVPSGATSESSRLYLRLLQEFEKAEPDVHVEFHPLNNWDDVVDVVRASPESSRAAVFIAEVSETLELEKLGLIEPFENIANRSGGLKPFLAPLSPEFLGNSYCRNGKFCGPPFVRSTPIALYNLDLLKQAGISKNQLPLTWSELEAMLNRLAAHSHAPPFCFGGDWYDYLFEATVRQSGGTLMDGERGRLTFASPEAAEALAFWKRLKDRGLLRRMNTWKATINAFTSGYCAVTYYSSGGMETVRAGARFSWMADILPRNKAYGVAVGGGNLYLSAGMSADEQQAAWKLVKFLYKPSVQARISAGSGFFPVVGAAFLEPELHERYANDEPFVRVQRQLKFAYPKMMSTDNLKARTILKNAIDRTLNDGMSPALSLQQAQQEVRQLGD